MSELSDIYAKNDLTKKMVELSNTINKLQEIATDLHVNHKLSPQQQELILSLSFFVYADTVIRNSAPAELIVTKSGDATCWRLDKLLQ